MLSDTDDCIMWPHGKCQGYGVLRYKGKVTGAHRLVLSLYTGETPNGKEACHSCHNPACINHRHLYWGSHSDNMADKVAAGTDSRGERSGMAKITNEQALAIRADKRVDRLVAEDYGVSRRTINSIKNRVNFAHV